MAKDGKADKESLGSHTIEGFRSRFYACSDEAKLRFAHFSCLFSETVLHALLPISRQSYQSASETRQEGVDFQVAPQLLKAK